MFVTDLAQIVCFAGDIGDGWRVSHLPDSRCTGETDGGASGRGETDGGGESRYAPALIASLIMRSGDALTLSNTIKYSLKLIYQLVMFFRWKC